MKMKTKTGWRATLLCCLAACLFAACDKENEEQRLVQAERGERLTVETSLQDFATEGQPDTRATVSPNVTTFEVGDKIGIFALKNGTLVADCNNVMLTYQGSGKWGGADIYDYGTGCTYLAYYPYRVEMNGKTSLDAIQAAFTIDPTQNTARLLAANDLLTGSTTVSSRTLAFSFTHAFCLLEFYAPEKVKCRTMYSNVYEYDLHGKATLDAIVIEDNSGNSHAPVSVYNAGGNLYRCIVRPVTVAQVIFSYRICGITTPLQRGFSPTPDACFLKYTAAYTAGNYYRLNVVSVNFNICDASLVYKDGSILPSECTTDLDPGNCVGIFNGTTMGGDLSTLPPAIQKCNHLTVIALHDAATCVFSTAPPEQIDFRMGSGYLETMYWVSKGAAAYPAANAAYNYRGVLPDIPNSGWYLDWFTISYPNIIYGEKRLEKMNAALSKIGGTPVTGIYWGNSISNDGKARCVDLDAFITTSAPYNSTYKVRAVFSI